MKPELLAIIFGAIIGCMAIIAEVIKELKIRKRDKISNRPSLIIERENFTDLPLKITLTNTGRGIALIDKFEIQVDDIFISGEYKKSTERVVSLLGLNGLDIIVTFLNRGDEIDVNQPHLLLEANPINSDDYQKISSALQRLNYKVKYSSIYNEAFVL